MHIKIYTVVHKKVPLLVFEQLHAAVADFNNLWRATSGRNDANDYTFGQLTLILSLHYLVKCWLLSLLFASGVKVCCLHSHWWRTF